MAILVLVLWLFTVGAGFYLLVTSNLGRARPAASDPGGRARTAPPPSRPRFRPLRQPLPPLLRQPHPRRRPAPPRRRLPPSGRCGGRRGTGSTRPR